MKPNLEERIAEAVKATKPGKDRVAALKAIKWRLVDDMGRFVGLIGQSPVATFIPAHCAKDAIVFDGRDNHIQKCAFYTSVLGVAVFPELLS